DRLERSDRATELNTVFRVLDGHFENELCTTDLFGGEADGGEVENAFHDVPTATIGSDEAPFDTVEVDTGLLAGLVHRGQWCSGDTVGLRVDGEEADTRVGAGRDDQQGRRVAVDDVGLGSRQRPGVTVTGRGGGHALLVP